MSKDFEVVKLNPGQSLTVHPTIFGGELRPTKLFILPAGSGDNKPSFAWELYDAFGRVWVAQISHKMLVDGLNQAGELVAIKESMT